MIEPTEEMIDAVAAILHGRRDLAADARDDVRAAAKAVLALVERDYCLERRGHVWHPLDKDSPRPAAVRRNALRDALEAVSRAIATDSRDWGQGRGDAWLWGVLVGWDCEEVHDHELEHCEGGALGQMAARHGWTAAHVSRIKELRRAIREASQP